ncbi:MAG: thiol-disulfide oxidoreductase DCC family protein [Raineya sp.]|jgi:predicted DCC family thiol-disulfide oxidoreductase YuxK|nr:thiol-disulfide oxidoreductase DCC family protein [Raineya sp.]
MNNPIILFDGVCNLCNSSVQFLIKNDKKNILRFASLQSEIGQNLLQKFNLPTNIFNSFVLIDGEQVYLRSSAALKVASYLGGAWKILQFFWIFPAFIRDGVYNLIAKNRYKWFGKRTECMIPTPELKARFLN